MASRPQRRLGWTQLSPEYRSRLIRHGITPESYREGVSITQARRGAAPEHPISHKWRGGLRKQGLLSRGEHKGDYPTEYHAGPYHSYMENGVERHGPPGVGAT